MKETTLFFLDKRHQFYLDVVSKLAQDADHRLVVVDISSLDYPLQSPWRTPKSFGEGAEATSQMFAKLGAEYVNGGRLSADPVPMNPVEESKLKIAIASTVSSWLHRGDKNFKVIRPLTLLLEKRLESQARHAFDLAVSLIKSYAPSKVYVENGRFSLPHAILLACHRMGVSVLFTGCYIRERRLYAREYRVHDRHALQKHALEFARRETPNQVAQVASEWLESRRSGHKSDALFTAFWNEDSSWEGPVNGLALFATSSSDETSNLDIDWEQGLWRSQFHAFSRIWDRLRNSELTPVLRVHPNLLNKNPLSALRDLREIRAFKKDHPEFIVVWPKSKVSSYDLLSMSSVVVVYNSTLGLEGSLMGKRVICASSTAYGEIADVLNVFDEADLANVRPMSNKADPRGAQEFVHLQESFDEYIPENSQGVQLASVGPKHLWMGLLDGSVFSALYELRWKLFRKILILITPK